MFGLSLYVLYFILFYLSTYILVYNTISISYDVRVA